MLSLLTLIKGLWTNNEQLDFY